MILKYLNRTLHYNSHILQNFVCAVFKFSLNSVIFTLKIVGKPFIKILFMMVKKDLFIMVK